MSNWQTFKLPPDLQAELHTIQQEFATTYGFVPKMADVVRYLVSLHHHLPKPLDIQQISESTQPNCPNINQISPPTVPYQRG